MRKLRPLCRSVPSAWKCISTRPFFEKRKETVLLRCSGVRFDGSLGLSLIVPCFDARKVVVPSSDPILTSESYVTDHESNEPFASRNFSVTPGALPRPENRSMS